jgi:chromosome segregation ATPase
MVNGIARSLHESVAPTARVLTSRNAVSLLGQYRAELEAAEAVLRAAFDEAAAAAHAARKVEGELRRAWEESQGRAPPPALQRTLDRLREQRAAWTQRKHDAQRAADEAGLRVGAARRWLQTTEDRARRLRRQVAHEVDAVQVLRRAVAAAEHSLAEQRDAVREKEAVLAELLGELTRLAGE